MKLDGFAFVNAEKNQLFKSGALKMKNKPTRSCGCLNKDRLGNLSVTWIIRVGATGFEPAT